MQGKDFNRNTAKNRKYQMNMAIKKMGYSSLLIKI